MRFTPGPWEARFEDPEPYISPNICRHVNGSNPNYEANARLIATAPELLEAAIEVRDVLRRDNRVFLADRLQQAIEKAESRS